MIEIFSELYKKVVGFFQSSNENDENGNAKNVACNRLKLVLMQDRTNLTPLVLERMRGEMIQLLSKYVEMDQEALELNFAQEGDSMALMLSIPVLRAKEESEVQAIIDAEEKAKAEAEAEKAQIEESEESEIQEDTETVSEESENPEDTENSKDEEVTEEVEVSAEDEQVATKTTEVKEDPDTEEITEEKVSKKSKKK